MTRTRIFVSFDRENDADLGALLRAQAKRPGSSFEILPDVRGASSTDDSDATVRAEIQAADEVLVICGEQTHESKRISVELGIAQEEEKPYLLLWGRREKMCTKPQGARPADAMYSWTRDILESQISMILRNAKPFEIPENCKRVHA
jgi:hypothetical protein